MKANKANLIKNTFKLRGSTSDRNGLYKELKAKFQDKYFDDNSHIKAIKDSTTYLQENHYNKILDDVMVASAQMREKLKGIFPEGRSQTQFKDPLGQSSYWSEPQLKSIENKVVAMLDPAQTILNYLDGNGEASLEAVSFIRESMPGEFNHYTRTLKNTLAETGKQLSRAKEKRLSLLIREPVNKSNDPSFTGIMNKIGVIAKERAKGNPDEVRKNIDLKSKIDSAKTRQQRSLVNEEALV